MKRRRVSKHRRFGSKQKTFFRKRGYRYNFDNFLYKKYKKFYYKGRNRFKKIRKQPTNEKLDKDLDNYFKNENNKEKEEKKENEENKNENSESKMKAD